MLAPNLLTGNDLNLPAKQGFLEEIGVHWPLDH